ncbi:MAG: pantetheine-phosphate adenylyltransferase [Gemmatimonas sp.]
MTTASAGKRIAIYAGSFDPLTNGHSDIIRRALSICDQLYVAVAINVNKQPLFPADERVVQIRRALGEESRVEVRAFTGLLVDFARSVSATINVRGLRTVSDFENEMPMAIMNRQLYPGLETVFLAASAETAHISSSLIREVAKFGGNVSPFVHPSVATALVTRFKKAE